MSSGQGWYGRASRNGARRESGANSDRHPASSPDLGPKLSGNDDAAAFAKAGETDVPAPRITMTETPSRFGRARRANRWAREEDGCLLQLKIDPETKDMTWHELSTLHNDQMRNQPSYFWRDERALMRRWWKDHAKFTDHLESGQPWTAEDKARYGRIWTREEDVLLRRAKQHDARMGLAWSDDQIALRYFSGRSGVSIANRWHWMQTLRR